MEQMKIEILAPQNMVNKGSSFLRVLMNEHTPILDLFVRESLQNCLDAADKTKGAVKVSYKIGEFKSSDLNDTLEGISEKLNNKYPENKYTFLCISDKGTTGLTGPLKIEDVKDGMTQGNLLKLVYDVGKPQDKDMSGGSWGYGKTIYSRIGMGLVLYYSRIKNDNGHYESRLAVCLAEDETQKGAMIPGYKGLAKYGIAWWGERIKENKTIPITDEEYIKNFLKIFGLSIYEGKDVGTQIIIPYIDKNYLLNDNAKEYSESLDDKHFVPYWRNSIEEYLRVAVQRWYFPRLNNESYKYGKWLEVDINGNTITDDSMMRIFQLYKALYNRAAGVIVKGKDFITSNEIEVYEEDIKVNKLSDRYAGKVSFVQIDQKTIGMCPPHNEYLPYINLGLNIYDITKNLPILAYTRRPGMIVSYEQDGEWVKDVPCTDQEEFIVAIFVLNSDAYINDVKDLSLDEYVRKGEQSDHISWNDTSKYGINLNTVYRIKRNTSKAISQYYVDEDEETDDSNSRISGLGRMLGKLILPPTGFGTKPTSRGSKPREKTDKSKIKSFSFGLDDIRYGKDYILVQYNITASKTTQHLGVDVDITSKSNPISMQAWEEELAMEKPFEISEAILKIVKKNGRKSYNSYCLRKDKMFNDDLLKLKFITTSKGTPHGIDLEFVSQCECEMNLTIKMKLYQRDICPKINFK